MTGCTKQCGIHRYVSAAGFACVRVDPSDGVGEVRHVFGRVAALLLTTGDFLDPAIRNNHDAVASGLQEEISVGEPVTHAITFAP